MVRVLFFLLFLINSAWATCNNLSPQDFLVYATDSVRGSSSDYQGSVGAGGSITLNNFFIGKTASNCFSIVTDSGVIFKDGSVQGSIFSNQLVSVQYSNIEGDVTGLGGVSLKSSTIKGRAVSGTGHVVNHNSSVYRGEGTTYERGNNLGYHFANWMHFQSTKFQAIGSSDEISRFEKANGEVVIFLSEAYGNPVVFNVSASFFQKRVTLVGSASKVVIFNVEGNYLDAKRFHINTRSLDPSNVLWNFYEASSVELAYTGNAQYGLPGSVLAPLAGLDFYEALITGQVFVKNLLKSNAVARNSGQVNASYFSQWFSYQPNPNPPTPPIPGCPPGTVYRNGVCVEPTPSCPAGTVYRNGVCVEPTPSCPSGSYYDPATRVCVIIKPSCPVGTYYDEVSRACVAYKPNCPVGTVYRNGRCERVLPLCPPGTYYENGRCIEVNPIPKPPRCPQGTEYRQNRCVRPAPPVNCPVGMDYRDGRCQYPRPPQCQEIGKAGCSPSSGHGPGKY